MTSIIHSESNACMLVCYASHFPSIWRATERALHRMERECEEKAALKSLNVCVCERVIDFGVAAAYVYPCRHSFSNVFNVLVHKK